MLLLDSAKLDQLGRPRPLAAQFGELLQQRIKFLPEPDRLLVELVCQHHLPLRKVGALIHLSPGSVTRKLRRIVNRLHDPIVVALLDSTCTLASDYRALGLGYFCTINRFPS